MSPDNDSPPLTPDEIAAIAEAETEIERGNRVSPEVIEAFWTKHGL